MALASRRLHWYIYFVISAMPPQLTLTGASWHLLIGSERDAGSRGSDKTWVNSELKTFVTNGQPFCTDHYGLAYRNP